VSKRKTLNRLLQRRELAVVADDELGERTYDRELRLALQHFGITCVLDVGANQGQFRDRLANQCNWQGPVISFEPVARYCEVLAERVGARDHWRVVRCALGAVSGAQTITLFDSPGLASLKPAKLEAMRDLLPRHTVEVIGRETIIVRRLGDVFDAVTEGLDTSRVFLKIDTQGYEMEVLDGALPILDRVALIQAEVSLIPIYEGMPSFAEVLARLDALGFAPSGVYPVTRDRDLQLIEADCLFVARRPPALDRRVGAPSGR
jgi:FkbM family methyltransferase